MKPVSIFLVIIGIICTFFMNFETTSSRKADLEEKDIFDLIEVNMIENNYDAIAWAVSNLPNKYNTNNDLSFLDGVKNGFLAPASYARDVLAGTVCDYLSGFEKKGFIMKIIWAVFGLVFEILKNLLFSLFGTIIFCFKLLFQKGSLFYYIGYIISLLISTSIVVNAISDEN